MKVVFDTNVLIDGFQDDFSACSRLIDAVCDEELEAVVSRPIKQEYRLILGQKIKDKVFEGRIDDFLSKVDEIRPADVDVVIDDREDLKFLKAAVGGKADYVISSDRHLLDIGEVGKIKIITPTEAWVKFEESDAGGSSAWNDFVHSLGIGHE
jgi:putative PIN family toxin of toxin-antitoxin system